MKADLNQFMQEQEMFDKSLNYLKLTGAVVLVNLLSMILTPVAFANEIGRDVQNFNTTVSGEDYITVKSVETLGAGRFGLGLSVNHAINTLPYFEDDDKTKQSRSHINDTVSSSEVHAGYGILGNWDIGFSLPAVLDQHVESDAYHAEYDDKGITEYRLFTKVRLPGLVHNGIAFIGSVNFNQTQNDPYTGAEAGPTYNLEVTGETSLLNLSLAANLGYRFRSPGEKSSEDSPVEPLNSQVVASGAAGFLFPGTKFKAIVEMFGSLPAKSVEERSDRGLITSEAITGVKYFASKTLSMNTGIGSEMRHAVGTPDWRFFAGMNWTTDGEVTSKGQPKKEITDQIPTTKPDEVVVIRDVVFEFDSTKIVKKGAKDNLTNVVTKFGKANDFEKIVIEGHTCNIGSEQYNQQLSQARAESIKKYLVTRFKYPAEKIVAVGFGESRPMTDNTSFRGRESNRRVEIKMWK